MKRQLNQQNRNCIAWNEFSLWQISVWQAHNDDEIDPIYNICRERKKDNLKVNDFHHYAMNKIYIHR